MDEFGFDVGFFDYVERNEYPEDPHPTDELIRELDEISNEEMLP